MMRLALAMALKDVRLTLFRSAGLVQALLLGLLLVFMFSLSQKSVAKLMTLVQSL